MNGNITLDKAIAGERLTVAEGVALFDCRDLNALGRAADAVCRRLHPEPYRTYNIDRNINYTNVCAAVCDFCAFYRKTGDADAYVLPREELYKKIEETIALGGDQILLQGGNHPVAQARMVRGPAPRPQAALSRRSTCTPSAPPEIWHFHKLNKLPLREVLRAAQGRRHGQPAGRRRRDPRRSRPQGHHRQQVLTDEWLEVHRVWHELGGRSTCTMMFGHVETLAERIEHLERLRQLAGRDRRLHRVHLLDVPARAHRHGRHPAGRRVRVSARRRPSPGSTSTTSRTSSRRG